MAITTTNTLQHSWNTSQGILLISICELRGIQGILRTHSQDIPIQQSNIKGIPEEATKSGVVFHRFLQSVYPRLSQLKKQEYYLHFEGRLLGGGGKSKNKGGKPVVKEVMEHVVEHVVAEAVAGAVGGAVAALLHTSSLNENAPYPEGPIHQSSPPTDNKKK